MHVPVIKFLQTSIFRQIYFDCKLERKDGQVILTYGKRSLHFPELN